MEMTESGMISATHCDEGSQLNTGISLFAGNSILPAFHKNKGGDYVMALVDKIALFSIFFLLSVQASSAQASLPHYPDTLFSTYYHQKATQFHLLPRNKDEIVFLGNSITDGGEWSELFQDPHIINRGISGDVTVGVLNRMDEIINRKPAKVFLLIGINDLARGVKPDSVLKYIFRIVSLIHEYSPLTGIYVQSLFPVNKKPSKFSSHVDKGRQIKYINHRLQAKAESVHFTFIDVYDALKDSSGSLNLKYTNDGLHLTGRGYMVWKHVIYPYVYDLREKPSLMPLPKKLLWTNEEFPLYECRTIVVKDPSLLKMAVTLQNIFSKRGSNISVRKKSKNKNVPHIELQIGKVNAPLHENEAYTMEVSNNKVIVKANTPHGIFNGIQTLRQLMRDHVYISGCHITDWPAFSWRGYMVDVGRNFQSVRQLKQQIDVMGHYKLNVFHLHLTENIAWRLQIKRYPQLTDPKYMIRNKGQYYTIREMHDLIQYCKDRFITLVPEIDMPGHSDAFTRTFGFNMQSDSGLKIVKNILTEVDSTYDVPYFHIGADEVRFTNKNFIPEVVGLIHDHGKQTVGWAPGGNYDDKTIRQLWQSEGPQAAHEKQAAIRYIDSRDLYLNHMDPLSGVISIFNRRIGDVNEGSKSMLGGEICLWNDDRAKNEEDILLMNLAYPAMLAFAERSWRGGGYDGFLTDLGSDASVRYKAFVDFENRLLDQKEEFFKDKPFPYARQSDIHWKLFGPFNHRGNAAKKFWPENGNVSLSDSTADLKINGGTIWLRHFFTPLVSGALKNPEPNTTWYAYRQIYSPVDTTGYFWINFYNPSRSHVVATPTLGNWDKRGSKIWVNGIIVPPPHWTYPGRDDNPENPLVDESYEYRPFTKVPLKKGWNKILVKAPVESFKGKDWQHPVKWMFTVVRVK